MPTRKIRSQLLDQTQLRGRMWGLSLEDIFYPRSSPLDQYSQFIYKVEANVH